MCPVLVWLLYLCQPWWAHSASPRRLQAPSMQSILLLFQLRLCLALWFVSFLFVAAFCMFDAHELISFIPLLSRAVGQRALVPVHAGTGSKDATALALAIWGGDLVSKGACRVWPCLIITGPVCSLGSSGGSSGSVGLQGMFYRTRQSLWDFLNFTQTFFFPFLPHFFFFFSFSPPSLLLNQISTRSHQKQSCLLKLSLATALK